MIRRLRARHRRMILLVAVIAGALMVAGLAARRSVPVDDAAVGNLVGK